MSSLTALILAAGQGTRMKSRLPKVLHAIAGRPLLYYPLRAAFDAGADRAVIVSSKGPEIAASLTQYFAQDRLLFVVQDPPRGTGDAARIGLAEVKSERVLLIYGDTPLVRAEDLVRLVEAIDGASAFELSLMTCELDQPQGYGRVLRDASGGVVEVREERDLKTKEERAVREVNAGMYAARSEILRAAVLRLVPNNDQAEFYLTDVVRMLGAARCHALPGHPDAIIGVNDRVQLRAAEERMFARIREQHQRAGVTLRGEVRIDQGVEIAEDVVIESGVRLRGATRIGRGSLIDVGCVLDAAEVGENSILKPYTVVNGSQIGDRAEIGPFSHLRPESVIEDQAHIGNFVETKKTRVRKGAKANHLAYLGDGDVGERANVGAGTIFCNYDGYQKHKTVIGEDAFIGSDSQLVAPIRIGKGAYVATGTTVTKDVPEDCLAIGRTRQENKPGYAARLRGRLEAAKAAALSAAKPSKTK